MPDQKSSKTLLPGTVILALLVATANDLAAEDATDFAAPEDGGPRRFAISQDDARSYAQPNRSAAVVTEFMDGAVVSNMGCAPVDGRIWCNVRAFRGGPRGFVAANELVPALGPDGTVPVGVNDSRRRARKGDFDAESEIACAQERGETLGRCRASVARSSGGDATVVVTFQNGFARSLYFIHAEFVSASATMSGVGKDVDWTLEGRTHLIRVDDQRFEMADEFVYGD